MVKIPSRAELSSWLVQNAVDWAQVIAFRAAMRALPFFCSIEGAGLVRYGQLPFRALCISWSAHNYPASNFRAAAHAAADAALTAAKADAAETNFADPAAYAAGLAAYAAAMSNADAAYRASDAASVAAAADNDADAAIWPSVQSDCQWLLDRHGDRFASRILTRNGLWLGHAPYVWMARWHRLQDRLLNIDTNYFVWIDWFSRRIRGERAAFDIPGDKYQKEDKKILRRLAEATDEDFWGKGHEYVNATLKGWLDEARARVAPPPIQAEVSGTFEINGDAEGTVQTPLQNRNAISFRTDEDGRIAIDAQAAIGNLRNDEDARDRHAEAVSEALALLNRCKGNNAAARLSLRLENYLAAAGADLENAKPSLLVQRGEKLRQELAAYAAPDTLLDPIADDILVDLKGWQSAHNMLVGLDPVLMTIDTAMLGPDGRPALMSPDEIREFAHDAQQADLLAEGTEVILIETADLAPEIPDPTNRLTNASIEMVRNLCIETVSIALNHPKVTAGVAVTAVALSSNVVAGIVGGLSLMSSIKAAEYLVIHRQWVEEKMGNTPTWQSLLSQVADWLEKVTPFKPK